MSARQLGVFTSESDVLAATRAARDAGLEVEDVFTPYPVHGIEAAMGLRRSRIPFACLAGGLLGCAGILGFEEWASVSSWAVDVGGKPFASTPAFIPIAFELTVLLGAIGAVAALLFRRGLLPGRAGRLAHPRVTDDRFVLAVRPSGARLTPDAITALLEEFGAEEVIVAEDPPPSPARRPSLRRVNLGLAAGILVAVFLQFALRPDPSERGVFILPGMARSVPYDSFVANPALPGGRTLLSPPEGSIPRGLPPERFERTKEDAAAAGERLVNPLAPGDPETLRRGKESFETYCLPCHGPSGAGDGIVSKRGFPPPASLLGDNARGMKDGQLYHVITVGQVNMPGYGPLVPRADRWRIVLYVRSLQAEVAK